jgi:transposase
VRGHLARRGDTYLRVLLIHCAKSAVLTAHRRSDPINRWALARRVRSGRQVAAAALANENVRIPWAAITEGGRFDARHVRVQPA